MDEEGTGVLTREHFSNMLAGVGIYLTAHEQERVKERCVEEAATLGWWKHIP